jgi:gliding motility-associated-like protein
MNLLDFIRFVCISCCAMNCSIVHSQIAVTNNPPFDNAQNLVEDVLLGEGIIANNFTWQNGPQNIGYFDGFNANIGFEEGLIMCTGGIDFVTTGAGAGPGISGDADLEQALSELGMSGFSVNNVTILEFDFIAQSDEMSFWYSFGSMEYTGYTCSSFNDVFGFFISGPGITGPYTNNAVNIALVPDPGEWVVDGDGNFTGVVDENLFTSTPVAVNTVNNGDPNEDWGGQCESLDSNWESYNTYWIDNDYAGNGWQGVNQPPSPEFTVDGLTGFTVALPAYINNLICDETYHIKLAIADCADGILNSAVFLEANSFSSPNVQISTVPNTELGLVLDVENGVLEGCGQAALQFDRGGDMTMDLDITLEYSGEATYGVDYEALPTELTLPAFQDQIVLPINVFFDEIPEGEETLIVTVSGVPVPCEVDGTVQDIELVIFDQEELLLAMPDQITIDCLGSANIEAIIEGGYPPYNYTWYNESGDILNEGSLDQSGILSINQEPLETTFYTLVVTDDCLDQVVTQNTDVIVQEQILSVELESDLLICEDDIIDIVLTPDITGGLPPYNYTWFYEGVVISNNASISSLPGEGLYQLIAEEACGVVAGDEILISFVNLEPYVELISYDVVDPGLLPESCFESILQFNVPEIQTEDINLDFNVTGSAELGLDYNLETSITIPAGESVFYVPVSILLDEEDEGVETIEFNFPFIDVCSTWPNSISIQIYEPPPLSVQLDAELILCEDEQDNGYLEGFVNGGVGNVNYAWYYDNEIVSLEMDLSTNNLPTGVYTFSAVDECNNSSAASINFDIVPSSPTVTLSSFDYSNPAELFEGCGSSTLTFTTPYPYENDTVFYYDIIGSSNFFNGLDIEELVGYIEIPAGENSISVDINPIFDGLDEFTENILFQFPFSTNCVPQEDIEIQINNYSPIQILLPSDQTVCNGQTLELEAVYSGGMPPYDVSWTYLDNSVEFDNLLIDVQEGVFPAVFTVEDGCGFSESSTILIEGLDVDFFEVVWPPNEVFACYGDNSEIILDIEGGLPPYSFQWFVDGNETTSTTPSFAWNDDYWIPGSSQIIATSPPFTPYIYEYQVLITDSCSNEIEYNIEVTVDECILPTSFTPNGDDNNDVFWLNLGDIVGPVSLDIFNRWGTLVYRSDDYRPCVDFKSGCWDGTYFKQFGQECSEGVYYYILSYSNPIHNVDSYEVSNFTEAIFGNPHNKNDGAKRTGSILLIR